MTVRVVYTFDDGDKQAEYAAEFDTERDAGIFVDGLSVHDELRFEYLDYDPDEELERRCGISVGTGSDEQSEYVVWWEDRYKYGGTIVERVEADSPEDAAEEAVLRRYDPDSATGPVITGCEVGVAEVVLTRHDVLL